MEMVIDFPGGARVDAHFNEFTVPKISERFSTLITSPRKLIAPRMAKEVLGTSVSDRMLNISIILSLGIITSKVPVDIRVPVCFETFKVLETCL